MERGGDGVKEVLVGVETVSIGVEELLLDLEEAAKAVGVDGNMG
jgi:hypothetical protein